MSKTVLILSYYFPPEGGPAVQRVSKFAKYLASFNYDVIVITSKHHVRIKDNSLLDDIKSVKNIYRIIDPGMYIPKKIIQYFYGKSFIDQHQLWNYSVGLYINSILKKNKVDILFSTSPPHSLNLIAYKISKQYKIPWIADFRDEWSYDPNFHKHFNKNQIIEIEKRILKFSAAVTTVTQKAKDNFSKTIEDSGRTYCIYNGYDEDDYKDISISSHNNHILKIIYTGRFTKKSSPKKLFGVLNEMKSSAELDFKNIEFNIVGQDGNKKWLSDFPSLTETIRFTAYQPHSESVKLLSESDVLLLLASNTLQSEVFTGKLFEYIYFRKPILAIIRYRGELSEWLENYGNVYIGIEEESESVERAILKMYDDFINRKLDKEVNEEFVLRYNRKSLAKSLAEIFDKVLLNWNDAE